MCILHPSLILMFCYFLDILDWIRMYYQSNCTESHVINYIIHFNAGIEKKNMLRHKVNRLEKKSLSSGPFTDSYHLP